MNNIVNKEYCDIYIAYILGWIVGNANIYDDELFFFIKSCNKDMVIKLYKLFLCIYDFKSNEIFYSMSQSTDFYLKIKNRCVINEIKCLFTLYEKSDNLSYKKNNLKYIGQMPKTSLPYFVRGIFDSTGFIYTKDKDYFCGIRLFSLNFLTMIMNELNIKQEIVYNEKYNNYSFTLYGAKDVIHFLDIIYKSCESETFDINLFLNRKYENYKEIKNNNIECNEMCFNYCKTDINAVIPFKMYINDIGYTLTLIKHIKTDGMIEYYDTGLIIKPPLGFYFELFCKNEYLRLLGYSFINKYEIIDDLNGKHIIIALVKHNKNVPSLTLPCSFFQCIPKQIYNLKLNNFN